MADHPHNTHEKPDELTVKRMVSESLIRAAGYEADEIATQNEKALDYYLMRPRGDEIAGRSEVISGDVSAMIDATLAQILKAFTTDSVIEFEASGPEDENQAQLESDVVGHMVMQVNPGYINFASAIKDALLNRNGILKVYMDEEKTTETKSYENVTEDIFEQLTTPTDPAVSVKVLDVDFAVGTARIRFTRLQRTLRIDPVPIENFLYHKNWNSIYLQDIPFCAERSWPTRSELLERGYPEDKINELKGTSLRDAGSEVARDVGKFQNPNQGIDKSQDEIEHYECYMRYDADADGIGELHQIMFAGGVEDGTILENERVSVVPFAAGTAFVTPHRFTGLSLFDKLKQIQDMKTATWRQFLDNANVNNNQRAVVIDGQVNMDDVMTPKPGGPVRAKRADAYIPIPVADITSGLQSAIVTMNQQRAELGGASLDMQTDVSAQLATSQVGSQGLERAYGVMESLAGMMAQNLAETLIKMTYWLTHRTLRDNFDQPVNIRQSGNWQSPVPSEWSSREHINVRLGMTPGERSRKVQALSQVIQFQAGAAQAGLDGVLVNIPNMHNAFMDWARSAELDSAERYFTDPASEQAQQAAQMKAEQAQQQNAQQSAIIGQALGLEELRAGVDKYKHDSELAFKYHDSALDAEVEESKIVGEATLDLERLQSQGEINADIASRTAEAGQAALNKRPANGNNRQ